VFPAVFINDPLFPVIEQKSMTIDPFQIDVFLLFSFQVDDSLKISELSQN